MCYAEFYFVVYNDVGKKTETIQSTCRIMIAYDAIELNVDVLSCHNKLSGYNWATKPQAGVPGYAWVDFFR